MNTNSISLYIDGSQRNKVLVSGELNGQRHTEVYKEVGSSQMILPLLERFLKKLGCSLDDVESLHIPVGPGSYTGLRVGAAIAQILGILCCVPLNERSASNPIELQYESAGNDRYPV